MEQVDQARIAFRYEAEQTRPAIKQAQVLYFITKRAIDILLSILLLVIFSPVILFVAILVRLDSPGPAIYSQKRVGCKFHRVGKTLCREVRTFTFYKFRSMYYQADDGKHRAFMSAYIHNDKASMTSLQQVPVTGSDLYKLNGDDRVTRIGKILRKTSLDELPQLWNVLKGDMSLVGPRPAIPYEVEMYEPWHQRRLYTWPGLTGMWQVTKRNSCTFEDMVKMDLEYIENQSFWLDMTIMLRTPFAVLQRKCK